MTGLRQQNLPSLFLSLILSPVWGKKKKKKNFVLISVNKNWTLDKTFKCSFWKKKLAWTMTNDNKISDYDNSHWQ